MSRFLVALITFSDRLIEWLVNVLRWWRVNESSKFWQTFQSDQKCHRRTVTWWIRFRRRILYPVCRSGVMVPQNLSRTLSVWFENSKDQIKVRFFLHKNQCSRVLAFTFLPLSCSHFFLPPTCLPLIMFYTSTLALNLHLYFHISISHQVASQVTISEPKQTAELKKVICLQVRDLNAKVASNIRIHRDTNKTKKIIE